MRNRRLAICLILVAMVNLGNASANQGPELGVVGSVPAVPDGHFNPTAFHYHHDISITDPDGLQKITVWVKARANPIIIPFTCPNVGLYRFQKPTLGEIYKLVAEDCAQPSGLTFWEKVFVPQSELSVQWFGLSGVTVIPRTVTIRIPRPEKETVTVDGIGFSGSIFDKNGGDPTPDDLEIGEDFVAGEFLVGPDGGEIIVELDPIGDKYFTIFSIPPISVSIYYYLFLLGALVITIFTLIYSVWGRIFK